MKKRLLFIAGLLACSSFALPAQESIPGSDRMLTVSGRSLSRGDTLSFNWSGTEVRIRFQGRSLKMTCADSGADWFNVFIDKPLSTSADKILKVGKAGFREISLVEGARKGTHDVIIQKRTEGEQGRLDIVSFETDGRFLQADGLRDRHIEFIGDSYTCGYGASVTGRDKPFKAEEEDANLSYASILGRFFDADVNLVSHSGRGIIRNYGDGNPGSTMPLRYLRTFDANAGELWDPAAAAFIPDIVVIYLGTNDFSTGKQPRLEDWLAAYKSLLETVRGWYGEGVPILCAAAPSGREMAEYVEMAARESGVPNVYWTALHDGVYNHEEDLGADWHPNYKGHRKVASALAPHISTLTGWPLPDKAIE